MRALLSLTSILTLAAGAALLGADWPSWRGPSHNGVSPETGLPVTWGAKCLDEAVATPAPPPAPLAAPAPEAQGQPGQRGRGGRGGREGRPITPFTCAKLETENVAWKVPLPAYSGSTPIIWGDTIFLNVATAANTGELELWAVDRRTQKVAWKRPMADTNHMERKQNMSSPSPVTDGKHVWVMTGVGALKAFDFAGKELWSRNIQADYGKFGLNWGYASSPLLKDNALFVQVLHGMKTDDPSYVLKIDALTGKTIWRVERLTEALNESPDSYTTPAWSDANGRPELIVTGGDVVSGHDPATGAEYW
ncbi:MAG TPA: PQQ-binding-like beta-propeller repeat protein, partial [Vicinamibacterales bacterium]|nr:PQQ-binding-like beta-propeller repeat protein [Vicinamibacterales bacterium]